MAAGRENPLDPRLRRKASRHGVAREQAARDHHGRIRRRRAARHGGDGDSPMREIVAASLDIDVGAHGAVQAAIATDILERDARLREIDAVMRAARPGDGAGDLREIDIDDLAVHALGIVCPQTLGLRISLDEMHLILASTGHAQIRERLLVERKEGAGAAVFGRHIGNARSRRGGKRGYAVAEALDEGTDHAFRAQDLGKAKRDIHRAHACGEPTRKMDSHDPRNERRDGLAETGRFGLDASDAPGKHTDTVRRRRMAIRTDNRIEIRDRLIVRRGHDALSEALDIDLMADSRFGRNDAHVLERPLRPFQKRITFGISLELHFGVRLERIGRSGAIGNDGMVDDQIERDLRIDRRSASPELFCRFAHSRKIDEDGDAREILEEHASRHIFDLAALHARQAGIDDALGETLRSLIGRSVAQDVFDKDPQRIRHFLRTWKGIARKVTIRLAVDVENGCMCHCSAYLLHDAKPARARRRRKHESPSSTLFAKRTENHHYTEVDSSKSIYARPRVADERSDETSKQEKTLPSPHAGKGGSQCIED